MYRRSAKFNVVINMNADLPYQIALTMISQIGPVGARIMAEKMGSARAVFDSTDRELEQLPGVGRLRIAALRSFKNMHEARREAQWVEDRQITPLFILDKEYPERLKHCPDAPLLLFQKGRVDFNEQRAVAIVGTRSPSHYGKQLTDRLLNDLRKYGPIVVSGLAYGIDAQAHQLALQRGLATVGVVAHGLDLVYPPEHRSLASEISRQGALISEFRSGTQPDRHHFPLRNRIVAGLCDAVIVVETGEKGGSLITADLAWGYNRDVFAFPGRITDSKSAGCHDLIRKNKAILIRGADDVADVLNWLEKPSIAPPPSVPLFVDLDPDEQVLLALFSPDEALPIDDLNRKSGLSNSRTAAALLGLELKNQIVSLPGKQYRLH